MDHGEGGTQKLLCRRCGHVGLDESDGFYYCQECGAAADDMILTGVAEEDFIDKSGGRLGTYSARFTRHSQTIHASQPDPSSQAWLRFTQEEDNVTATNMEVKKEVRDDYYYVGPTEPDDFGSGAVRKLSYEDYYNEVRIRYVMGMQWMIQLQCEALVEKFNVRPLVCGVAGTVWLRFLAGTGVFKEDWADDVLLESESQRQGELEDPKLPSSHKNEPRNAYGQRAVRIWFKHLKKTLPLSSSLAISFLACHVAREAILPTDIVKWSIEGKLPYFAAHVEIEKRFGRSSPACPISSSLMFRPSQTVPVQILESMAAIIAESIGLHLPPANFYEIASCYLKKLSLPVEKILPHACCIYEWSMPPDLWLSSSELRLPTRVCVMSILIVTVRILYNINGFGVWERSLSIRNRASSSTAHTSRLDSSFGSETKDDDEKVSGSPLHRAGDDSGENYTRIPSQTQKSELDCAKLLNHLEAAYAQIGDKYEFTNDLPSYLQYCKDVVFAGAGQSQMNHLEEELIEKLWDFYENAKDCEIAEEPGMQSSSAFNQRRSGNDDGYVENLSEKRKIREEWHDSPSVNSKADSAANSTEQSTDEHHISNNSPGNQNLECNDDEDSDETLKDRAIRQLKLDMEENRFCYIPPRVILKRFDYLHYVRKQNDGALSYVAHADYYILLRSCARAAQVDIRIMHMGVMSFERRLAWLEKRIDHCLHLTPPVMTCEFCRDMSDHSKDDSIGLSNLNL